MSIFTQLVLAGVDLLGMAPRNRLDQSSKQILSQFFQRAGVFTAEEEVFSIPQRTDGRFTPDPERLWTLGNDLLGRIGQEACAFEVFSKTPGVDTLVGAVRKVLNLRHLFQLEADKGQQRPSPRLWVISTGYPATGIEALGAKRNDAWPTGIYDSPFGFQTSIVAINQLPHDPSTLLLRLMGRGPTLSSAVHDLLELPQHSWEKRMATEILAKYYIVQEPKELSPEEQEYLKKIEPILKQWEEEDAKKWPQIYAAHDEGLRDGERGTLLEVYSARFGQTPDPIRQAIEQANDKSTLRSWIRAIATGTQDDIARTILQGFAPVAEHA